MAKGTLSGTQPGQASSRVSVVRTVCSQDIVLTRNGTSEVSLPDLPAFGTWSTGDRPGPVVPIKMREPLWEQRNESLTGNDHLTTVFVTPDPKMTSVTTGVVVLGPLTDHN